MNFLNGFMSVLDSRELGQMTATGVLTLAVVAAVFLVVPRIVDHMGLQ